MSSNMTMKIKPKIEIHDENSETHSKTKEPLLAKYVRRHHAPNHIIGDESYGTMTKEN